MEESKEEVANCVAEKKLNGCKDLFDAEEKKEKEAKKTLKQLGNAIKATEAFLSKAG